MNLGKTQLYVFDVEHGACNAIITPNNQLIMIDCGHNASTGWRPSDWVVQNRFNIKKLVVSNVDEDHVSDLCGIDERRPPEIISINSKLSANRIKMEKRENGIGPGVKKYLEYKERYKQPAIKRGNGLDVSPFFHCPEDFSGLNNLSVVTFIEFGDAGIIFPGDLEKDGWEKFLERDDFCQHLENVNIFIASHHGRENGFCREVFDYCNPDLIVISDKEIMYGTQEHSLYSNFSNGILHDGRNRKVLTTRNDHTVKFDIYQDGSFRTESLEHKDL